MRPAIKARLSDVNAASHYLPYAYFQATGLPPAIDLQAFPASNTAEWRRCATRPKSYISVTVSPIREIAGFDSP